jgi:hypothetical protein
MDRSRRNDHRRSDGGRKLCCCGGFRRHQECSPQYARRGKPGEGHSFDWRLTTRRSCVSQNSPIFDLINQETVNARGSGNVTAIASSGAAARHRSHEAATALKAEPERPFLATERLQVQNWSKSGSAAARPSKAERRAEAKARGYERAMCGATSPAAGLRPTSSSVRRIQFVALIPRSADQRRTTKTGQARSARMTKRHNSRGSSPRGGRPSASLASGIRWRASSCRGPTGCIGRACRSLHTRCKTQRADAGCGDDDVDPLTERTIRRPIG